MTGAGSAGSGDFGVLDGRIGAGLGAGGGVVGFGFTGAEGAGFASGSGFAVSFSAGAEGVLTTTGGAACTVRLLQPEAESISAQISSASADTGILRELAGERI